MSTLIEVMTTWNKNGTPQKPVPTTKVLFRLNPNYDPVSPTKKQNDHLTIRGGTFSPNIMGMIRNRDTYSCTHPCKKQHPSTRAPLMEVIRGRDCLFTKLRKP